MSLSEKAKTSTFIHNELYYKNANPDEKWVRLEDARQEIDKLKTLLLKYNNEVVEYEQKLRQSCEEIRSKLKFLDYEQYHGDLKQSFNPTLREIHKLLEELLK